MVEWKLAQEDHTFQVEFRIGCGDESGAKLLEAHCAGYSAVSTGESFGH